MAKFFISYRRDDTEGVAGRIFDRMADYFGRESLFFDVDTIPPGVDFRQHISEAVSQCNLLLALIGKKWLRLRKGGKRRLDDPEDFVRIEIQTALERKIPVVPVLVGGLAMPAEEDLPPELAGLAFRNALPVDPGRDFHAHMERLIRKLTELLGSPAGDLTGDWIIDDGNWKYDARLKQIGKSVSGEYDLRDGTGTIDGLVEGDLLKLHWDQPFNQRGGEAQLEILPDGEVMTGRWRYDPINYNSGLKGGGAWTFRKQGR